VFLLKNLSQGGIAMGILDLFSFNGKVVIITGAGRGLGKVLALSFAEAGADIIVADIIEANAFKVSKEIEKMGKRTLALKLDVTQIQDVDRMVKVTLDHFSNIDILVNNAGIVYQGKDGRGSSVPLEENDPEDWEKVIKVNLYGVFLCTQAVGKVMIRQRKGTIINIASQLAFHATYSRYSNAYCASKAGVVMFTRELATEWGKYNIRVNAIAPVAMKTEMGKRFFEIPEMADLYKKQTPLGRFAEPEDMRGPALFLASEASGFVTGQTILVDGGLNLY
jgi:gluconate 5-dehydrogenase